MRIAPVIAIAVSVGLSACSTTKSSVNPGEDGVKLWGGGSRSSADVQKLKEQLAQNAQSSAAKGAVQQLLASDVKAGALIIGNVGSFRKIEEKDRPIFYQKSYLVTAEKWHPGQPAIVSEAQFSKEFAGVTQVVVWSIPGLLNRRHTVAVLESDVEKINFPGRRMANLFLTTGDLVVAGVNGDGALLVEGVLCSETDPLFSQCVGQFTKGTFDRSTGLEIDGDAKAKPDGARIDVATYHTITK